MKKLHEMVTGFYFSKNGEPKAFTMSGERYCCMVDIFLKSILNKIQQGDTTCLKTNNRTDDFV